STPIYTRSRKGSGTLGSSLRAHTTTQRSASSCCRTRMCEARRTPGRSCCGSCGAPTRRRPIAASGTAMRSSANLGGRAWRVRSRRTERKKLLLQLRRDLPNLLGAAFAGERRPRHQEPALVEPADQDRFVTDLSDQLRRHFGGFGVVAGNRHADASRLLVR